MKSQNGRRRWVAGALRAGRAAAFLTLATGINGTIAALEPRYEPIYVYLAAVVIVAWLGSLLLGVTTAVAAVILYDAMFSPFERNLTWGAALPFVVAIGAAVVTRMARVPVERRRAFPPSAPPPLLETSAPKVVEIRSSLESIEIEDLRQQLADAGRRTDEVRRRFEETRAQLAEAQSRASAAESEHASAERRLSQSTSQLAETEARLAAAQSQLDAARAETEKETRLRAEQMARTTVRLAALQRELETSRAEATERAARAAALERDVEAARTKAAEAEARLAETTEELEVAWRRVDEEKARADKEDKRLRDLEQRANEALQKATSDLAARYQEPLTEAKKRLEEAFTRIPTLENERDAARLAAGEAAARIAAFEEETTRLRSELAAARQDLERAKAATESERSQREAAAAESDRKIASIADRLTRDYENSLGEATIEREAARAEVRTLKSKVESLQTKLELERAQRESIEADLMPAARAEIAALTATIETLEARLREADGNASRLQRELEETRSRADAERAEHEAALEELDGKIASIVAGITSDHEHAIGEAVVEREAARAEVRALTGKVETLQEKLESERLRADEERAAREKLDAEWSEKLQTIVNHLASDHEADLGEAMLEKEAARAEVRVLTARVKVLEQRLESERQRTAQQAPGPTVLVAHSDAGTRAMAKHTLEQAGYTVLTAADGLEALRMAATQRPDAVLAEAIMPKMNGRELLQLLKARSETAGVKFILMSGGESDRNSDFRADSVLTEPSNFAAMKAAVAAVLAE